MMGWSYSFNPSFSPRDEMRFLVGDTNPKDPLFQDGECDYLLARHAMSALAAAVQGCEMVMAKYSRMADETVGSVSIQFSQRAKGYLALRKTLTTRLAIEGAVPYCGGLSISDKRSRQLNRDRVSPAFTKEILGGEGTVRGPSQQIQQLRGGAQSIQGGGR